jgi:hypothetical protein
VQNRKIVLAARPDGMPTLDGFRLEEEPVRSPDEGAVLIEVDHLSIDAFIRTTLDEVSFHPSAPLGGTIAALGVGRVLESGDSTYQPGDAVWGPLGAQTHALLPTAALRRLDEPDLPLTAHLGVLGLTTGLTSYFGIRGVAEVKPGDTVLVSAAAGAVGSVAGQIAKLDGGRVIGIAGGPHKLRFLEDLGFDAGIDYKGEDVDARLRELAPDGIDVYFDNVGGELLDIALDHIRDRARVVICGAISQYNDRANTRGPSLYLRLAERYARMEGFTVNHFAEQLPQASKQLADWLRSGQIRLPEHVEDGIERFPRALIMLFDGSHMGKLLVRTKTS